MVTRQVHALALCTVQVEDSYPCKVLKHWEALVPCCLSLSVSLKERAAWRAEPAHEWGSGYIHTDTQLVDLRLPKSPKGIHVVSET